MIFKIRVFFWKVRYAIYFGDRLELEFSEAWNHAGSSLENINYEVSECPMDIADEDINVWRQNCDTKEIV